MKDFIDIKVTHTSKADQTEERSAPTSDVCMDCDLSRGDAFGLL